MRDRPCRWQDRQSYSGASARRSRRRVFANKNQSRNLGCDWQGRIVPRSSQTSDGQRWDHVRFVQANSTSGVRPRSTPAQVAGSRWAMRPVVARARSEGTCKGETGYQRDADQGPGDRETDMSEVVRPVTEI